MGIKAILKKIIFSPSAISETIENISLNKFAFIFLISILIESILLSLTPDYFLLSSYSVSFEDMPFYLVILYSFLANIFTLFNMLILLSLLFSVSLSPKKAVFSLFTLIMIFFLIFSVKNRLFSLFILFVLYSLALFHIRTQKIIVKKIFKISSICGLLVFFYIPFWAMALILSSYKILEISQVIFALWNIFVFSSIASRSFSISIPKSIFALFTSALISTSIFYAMKITGLADQQFFKFLILQG